MNADKVALTVLALAEVPQVMSAFEPSPFTMGTYAHDAAKVRLIRREYYVGGGVALAIAAAAAHLIGSWFPFLGALAVLGITIHEYEYALRTGDKQDMITGAPKRQPFQGPGLALAGRYAFKR